jgi:myo-inositol-hexaphosphate 3-phosphohydrolase
LTDADQDGLYAGTLRRTFEVGSEAEGCVVDDRRAALYVSQEDVGLWRYGANPADGTARAALDTVMVTLAGNRIIVSAQSTRTAHRSYFAVYDRTTNAYVGAFRVSDGAVSDDCDGTDGVAAYDGALGPAFPGGLFVCQDQANQAPSAKQDFKLVRWDRLPL